MFEPRREKILLALTLGLLAAVVLDRLLISPLWRHVSGADARTTELRREIAQAEKLLQRTAASQERIAGLQRRLRVASEQGQNEFRGYLEGRIDPNAELTSSAQISDQEIRESPGLRRITYELHLLGRQDALRAVLENLDASEELLRFEKLEITGGSQDDPRLKVTMLVSTIASATAEPGAARRPFAPSAVRAPPLLAKNVFFPAGGLSPGVPAGAEGQVPETGEFVLAGTIASAQRRAALFEFPASGRIRWAGVGEQIGGMTIVAITAEDVQFQLGGERSALAVGRPRTDLLAGRRVLVGGFELVGVCHGGDQRFAMVQLDDGEKVQQVHLKDRLGSGVVVGISDDGIVLEIAGAHRSVPVGGRFAGKAEL